MRKPLTFAARALAVSAVAMGMLSIGAAPALAFDEDDAAYIQHLLDCKLWLFTDSARHARNCLPNTMPRSLSSLALPVTDGGQARMIVSPQNGSKEPPDCDDKSYGSYEWYSCDCWKDYSTYD
jgi:hypothetical protein